MMIKPDRIWLWFSLSLVFIFMAGCSGNASPAATEIEQQATQALTSATVEATVTQMTLPSPTASATVAPTETPAPFEVPAAGIEVKGMTDINLAEGLGTHWVRRNALLWFNIEPEAGMRNWEEAAWLEEELIRISEAGMEAVLIVRGAPDWALRTPGIPCGVVQRKALDEFAAFLGEAVGRYKDPPYNVKYWELGNEPDVDPSLVKPSAPFGCWGDVNDPNYYGGATYAEMLKVAYPAIKEADAEAQVLVGGLLMDCDPVRPPETAPGSGQPAYCTPSRYLEGILESGGGEYFDGVSFHGYDYYYGAEGQFGNRNWHSEWNTTGPVTAAKAGYLRALLASYGYADKFLMNTENALLCGRDGSEAECQMEAFANTKAYYLVQSSTMALAEGLKANIWYDLQGWRGSGLIDENRQTLQAFQAYQFNILMLNEMAYWGRVTGQAGVSGYEFRLDEKIMWVVWSLDGMTHELTVPGKIQTVYDVYGNMLTPEAARQVTLAPVYIIWTAAP